MGLETKIKEMRLVNAWPEIVGVTVSKVTKDVSLRGGVLFVSISSSVVKNELFMLREGLQKALNDRAGEQLVKKIVFR